MDDKDQRAPESDGRAAEPTRTGGSDSQSAQSESAESGRPFRGAPRARAALRVRLFGDAEVLAEGFWTVTRDVSHRGAFLRCEQAFAPGTRVRLEIEGLRGEEDVQLEAEVKWCSAAGDPERGVGVEFIAPPVSVRRRLDRIQSEGELPVFELYEEEDGL
jgi:Tfp pilus assembly protein PilZ